MAIPIPVPVMEKAIEVFLALLAACTFAASQVSLPQAPNAHALWGHGDDARLALESVREGADVRSCVEGTTLLTKRIAEGTAVVVMRDTKAGWRMVTAYIDYGKPISNGSREFIGANNAIKRCAGGFLGGIPMLPLETPNAH